MTRVKVMTYNIFMGGRKRAPLDRLVQQVRPDVLLVNESPKTPLLWRRRCRLLATGWEMTHVGGGRNAGSNAIMVPAHVEVESTDATPFRTGVFQPRRGTVAAWLKIETRSLGVVSCHLSLAPSQRAKEVEQVIAIADTMRGVVVVAGDLNEPPGGPSWHRLREAGYRDHGSKDWPTFPAATPQKRIDALLVRGEANVVHHGDPGVPTWLQEQASDHRGVLALLEI